MLDNLLIIDSNKDIEGLVRYFISDSYPDAGVSMYDPSDGLPSDVSIFKKYQILLLNNELGLAGENGVDWLEILVHCPNIPPILFMSNHAQDDLSKKSIASGAVNYFGKNEISAKQFTQIINEIISNSHPKESDHAAKAGSESKKAPASKDRNEKANTEAGNESKKAPASKDRNEKANTKAGNESQKLPVSEDHNEKTNADPTHKTMMFAQDEDATEPRTGEDTRELVQCELPGYKIIGKLGQGGMASIYLAEREEDQLWVALKVLDIANMNKQKLLRRFMREYRALSKISHPNIARIYERAFSMNYAYIAMEYCPDGDLAQMLEYNFLPEVSVGYIIQIAKGLSAAHKINIIHRDLKPENVLCRSDGTLALTDFGIAVHMDMTHGHEQAKEVIGTAHYISPEQINGDGAGKHSDLYSMGVIFYKMLTGKLPFRGKSIDEILQAHLSSDIPKLPEDLKKYQPVIEGLLVKDPDERFQDAEQLIAGLELN